MSEICNSWAVLIPYTWFLGPHSKPLVATELWHFNSVSPFLNFKFYVFDSYTKPSLVLIWTWAINFLLVAARNGVWFLWSDNWVIFPGMMRVYYYILVILGPILYLLKDNSECVCSLSVFLIVSALEHVLGAAERIAFDIQMSGVVCLHLTSG